MIMLIWTARILRAHVLSAQDARGPEEHDLENAP